MITLIDKSDNCYITKLVIKMFWIDEHRYLRSAKFYTDLFIGKVK